jgi:hypothetical protein
MMHAKVAAYPFQKALRWQGKGMRVLTERDELALYERNWRMLGVLAEPDAAEIAHIRELAKRHHSWLLAEIV